MSPQHRNFLGNLLTREASWLLLGLVCFAANFTVFRMLPGELSIWTVIQIVLIAIFLCGLSIWVLWAQINSVEISTRDESPIDDRHGSEDMGWTYWTYVLFGAMYVLAAFGGLMAWLAADKVPQLVIHSLYVSWPIIIYTPFMYALSRIDLGPIAIMYQRMNRFRTKLSRYEEQAAH